MLQELDVKLFSNAWTLTMMGEPAFQTFVNSYKVNPKDKRQFHIAIKKVRLMNCHSGITTSRVQIRFKQLLLTKMIL